MIAIRPAQRAFNVIQYNKQKRTQMTKLIRAYHANQTRLNALKIKFYSQKHPMAACMLIGFEAVILKNALEHAEKLED